METHGQRVADGGSRSHPELAGFPGGEPDAAEGRQTEKPPTAKPTNQPALKASRSGERVPAEKPLRPHRGWTASPRHLLSAEAPAACRTPTARVMIIRPRTAAGHRDTA